MLRAGMTMEGPGGLQPRNDMPSIALEQQWARSLPVEAHDE